MIDLIHFGFCTGTSLIFEGFPGQGKQKAVNYYCNLLNCEDENIVITSNFSAKDLFKKSIVQTNSSGIVEIVEVETKNTKYYLIVTMKKKVQ
jgi:MoxR-like ATPase